jgi:molecular chaperone HscA
VDAERLLDATRHAMQADSDLLTKPDIDAIHAAMADLAQKMNDTDHLAIRAAAEHLARVTEAFAAQRMNRSIQRALAGRSVSSLMAEAPAADPIIPTES